MRKRVTKEERIKAPIVLKEVLGIEQYKVPIKFIEKKRSHIILQEYFSSRREILKQAKLTFLAFKSTINFLPPLQCFLGKIQAPNPTSVVATNSMLSPRVESSIISKDSNISNTIIRKVTYVK